MLAAHTVCAGDQPARLGMQSGNRDGHAPAAATSTDASGRIGTWLEQRLEMERGVIARAAETTPEQDARVAAAAQACRAGLADELDQQSSSLQQTGAIFIRRGGRFQKVAVGSLVFDRLSSAIAGELTDAQRAAYQREVEARTRFWQQANVAALGVLLDEQLYLSAEQRAAVIDQLEHHWPDAAHFDLAAYFQHSRCVPNGSDDRLQSILDPSQRQIWTTMHAVDHWRGIDRHARPSNADESRWLEEMLLQTPAGADRFRQALIAQCEARVRQIDEACSLAPDQKEELMLAGRGDVERFSDRAAVLRDQLTARASDPGRWVRVDHDRLMPLQQALADGIFASGSLFEKVLARRLTAKQAGLWQQVTETSVEAVHAAQLRLLVATLNDSVPMLQSQRSQLLELLKRRTQPTMIDHEYAQYVLIHHAAAVPADLLRDFLDARQIAALDRVFQANQSAEIFLRQNGLLPTAEFQDGEDD